MLLARHGYRVLLVDRATFPSDTMSTHVCKLPACWYLQRWGLLDAVASSNCPPIRRLTVDVGPFALSGSAPPLDGVDVGYSPRRRVLDSILLDAAASAGAEIRQGVSVEGVVRDEERVVGISARTPAGSTIVERAGIVIGADGLHSLVARAVEAPITRAVPSLTCAYYSNWSGVQIDGAEFFPRPERMIIAFATNDGQTCVIAWWPVAEFSHVRADVEHHFAETLEMAPSLAERVRSGRREERFVGTADLPNFFRTPFGPGWALVGDSGLHRDPITAQGISDAFRDVDLLASAVHAGLSGTRPIDAALADYEQQRDAAAMPMFELTCQMAALQPPSSEMQQLFGALIGSQEDTNRFLGTIEGTVSIPEFYAPTNLAQIIGGRPSASSTNGTGS
jgi:2-polyprenyl-6-methoxyphenol hydroxylase-like FAD-dependent oxidoreductase